MIPFSELARKEALVLLRDRHGLFVLFVMPAVFIVIMSLALRDALSPGRLDLALDWVDEDRGYFALALSDAMDEQHLLSAQPVADAKAMQARLASGEIEHGLRIAPGFDDRIKAVAEGATGATLVELWHAPTAAAPSRMLVESAVRGALAKVQSEFVLEDLMGVPHADASDARATLDPRTLPLAVRTPGVTDESVPNAVQQSVPAWLVFAMFFVVLPIATSVLAERDAGNLQRLRLANVSPLKLLAGKFPAYFVVNQVQLLLMLAAGVWLVPVLGGDRLSLGAQPAGLWVVAAALSIAAIGFALLVAVVARTAVQATTLGGVANLMLGAIGGVMVPKSVMPEGMRAAADLSPMSWALEGCWDILLRGGGVEDVLPESAALLGFGALCLGAAVALFPSQDA